MKGKVKGTTYAVLIMLLVACLLTGCKEKDEAPSVSSVGETTVETGAQSEAVTSQSLIGNSTDRIEPPNVGEMIEALDEQECPEGYVYDYQVSMEPILEEIAALGGPCQGTIHAFPSKIGMALTELEMEKDPVLKAEVEKRIPEVEAALEEEIGGDFTVDGVIEINKFTWIFMCTDNITGEQFDLCYANHEYNGLRFDNIAYTDDYYDEIESKTIREDLLPILKNVYSDSTIMVRLQRGVNVVDIVIVKYTDENIDKTMEQKVFLDMWEHLQEYSTELYYNINLSFFSKEYKNVIEEKMTTRIRYDFCGAYSNEVLSTLIENGEIWNSLYYSESKNEEDNIMDKYFYEYKSEKYNEEIEWQYWIQ